MDENRVVHIPLGEGEGEDRTYMEDIAQERDEEDNLRIIYSISKLPSVDEEEDPNSFSAIELDSDNTSTNSEEVLDAWMQDELDLTW